MISQREYWDQKIKQWTGISYGREKKRLPLLEKAANLFRGPIKGRLEVALKIIGRRAKGKIILEMGCGLGDFCFEILKYHPQKVIGIDIAGVAIRAAKKEAERKKVAHKIKFIRDNLTKMEKLPRFHIAVGLGFIDYLNKRELKRLFRLLVNHSFLFSVFERKLSLMNLIHPLYMKIQNCPGSYKFTREEIKQLAPKNLGLYFRRENRMLFITNLPKEE